MGLATVVGCLALWSATWGLEAKAQVKGRLKRLENELEKGQEKKLEKELEKYLARRLAKELEKRRAKRQETGRLKRLAMAGACEVDQGALSD